MNIFRTQHRGKCTRAQLDLDCNFSRTDPPKSFHSWYIYQPPFYASLTQHKCIQPASHNTFHIQKRFFPSPFYMQFSWCTLSSLPPHQPRSCWQQVSSLAVPDRKGNKSRWSILSTIHLHVSGGLVQKLLNRTCSICTAVRDVWRPFPAADALIWCTSILTRTINKT